MKIKSFVLSVYKSNCYIVYKERKAIVIDPGEESQKVIDFILENKLKVIAIYATHGHIDHVAGIKNLKEKFNAPTYGPEKDKIWFEKPPYNTLGYVIPIDTFINEGDQIILDDLVFDVYDTPGHSQGGTVLYNIDHNICFSGDTLFHSTIGRTDLPFGSFDQIKTSILKMYNLFADDTRVYPGHGGMTSIGFEKQYNQFVRK